MLRSTSTRNKPAHSEAKIRPTSMFKFYSRIEKAYSQLLKTTVSNSKFDMINQRLKNVRRASCRVIWLKNHDKNLEGHKNCECYVSKKIQENNFVFSNCFFFLSFFLCVSPVLIIFYSHFWLSLEQQSGRGHMSIRRQKSIKL